MRTCHDRPSYYVCCHIDPGGEPGEVVQTRCKACNRSLWYDAEATPSSLLPRLCVACAGGLPGVGEALSPFGTNTDWETAAERGIERVRYKTGEYAFILGKLLVPVIEVSEDTTVLCITERMFPDDEEAPCARCGCACYHRPGTYAPDQRKLCMECGDAEGMEKMAGGAVN